MKTIIWSLFILILAVWTGMTLLTVHLVDWIAQSFGATLPNDLGAVLNTIPVPPLLALWIDAAWIQSIHAGLVAFIEALTQTVPYFASAIDWLSPLIWAIWALGAIALLILTIVGHWLVGSLLTPSRTNQRSEAS
ncbi:hypothetical protein GO613_11800 [Azoarcus communis]|uniref:Uncharacterized protein n=1 Tax=Thauera chlorobenzoica TaxID=96773 RepID=A0A1H5WE80_9RHOO|nr:MULTISPECIES: hypothetical protein [Zoogloeaceae]APR03168.1 hypothetical protein Tchl_0295 [Thauera chlorobenzoica]NMG48787.1 hypothetical protein [Parazoarcus communis]SEF97899.1 hypothetical protein SAMN05216242_11193 [Thauera chlorobenzoica]